MRMEAVSGCVERGAFWSKKLEKWFGVVLLKPFKS